jgi:O-antigen/teichoic acid export membrane protein
VDLTARAVKATAWFGGTRLCLQMVMWVVGIALARVLSPADYGVFAMAMAVIAFLDMFQELGLGTAIVREHGLTRPQVNALFWVVIALSTAVTTVAFLIAPVASTFYGQPQLTGLLRALAAAFLLNSLGMVPFSLLTREIEFRGRSLAEAAGALSQGAVAIVLAWNGQGVWALVGGHLARSVVRNIGMLVASGWVPGLDVRFEGLGRVMRFGLHVSGATIVANLGLFVRRAVVGRYLGSHDFGMWDMAGSLGERNPVHKVSTSVINQLSLPVFAKLQREEAQLRRSFLQISRCLAILSLPMQVGMVLIAHDLVALLLTEKWLPVVPLLQVFSLAGIFSILPLPAAPLLTARGHADVVFRVTLVSGVVRTLGKLAVAPWGLVGFAAAWATLLPASRVWLLLLSLRESRLGVGAYVRAISSAAVATAVMAAVVLGVRAAGAEPDVLLARMIFDVVLGAAVYTLALLAIDRRLGVEMRLIATALVAPSRA